MKRFTLPVGAIFIACSALLQGCSESPDDVAKAVTPLLQQQLDQGDFKQYGMKVERVSVMHEDGNKFHGVADIAADGETHTVPLDILDDGKHVMFTAAPGSFGFLIRLSMKRAVEQMRQQESGTVKSLIASELAAFEHCQQGKNGEPDVAAACAQRDAYDAELQAMGQCYGPSSIPISDRHWGPCNAQ